MAKTRNEPLQWYMAPKRAFLPLDDRFHVPRKFAKFIRSHTFRLTVNQAFAAVVEACADRADGATWISHDYAQRYEELHRVGLAHSVEAWRGDQLVGGLYGLALGGYFSGESMFSRESNASKTCLMALVQLLRRAKYVHLDCQISNAHTEQFGALETTHGRFLGKLAKALCVPARFPAAGDLPPDFLTGIV